MKNVYFDTNELDNRAVNEFGISAEILMENAASAIEKLVRKKLKKGSKILALCGTGNNGADALCALRKLSGDYKCFALMLSQNQNELNKKQSDIARLAGVSFISELALVDCYIDGIFGSGLNKELEPQICKFIEFVNGKKALKIAVDIPSGIYKNGNIGKVAFRADYTVTMGALKLALFSDLAKDFVGKIKIANLGICKTNFQTNADMFLLEKKDLILPKRTKKNTNKGDFGHLYIVSGDMSGASQIAGLCAYRVGVGLVSLVSDKKIANLNPVLMQKKSLNGAKFILCGQGLGDKNIDFCEFYDKSCVIDADMFYKKEILELLTNNDNLILTPHPKEFSALLTNCKLTDVSVSEIQKNRFLFAKKFSEKFGCVLVLKGANTLIAQNGKIYICDKGSQALAKGGSGDCLSGIIAGLLTQGFSLLNSAINGVLIHAIVAKKITKKNNFSLISTDIIKGLKWL